MAGISGSGGSNPVAYGGEIARLFSCAPDDPFRLAAALGAARHVFHFDRAFRIGQTRDVQVHKFLCVGTLEEKIDEMIERKQEVARRVVGTGEGWLTELSNEQLKDLFALRQEAIGD